MGHFRATKTLDLLTHNYYWPNLRETVRDYIRTCDACQRTKLPRRLPNSELELLPAPQRPWTDISVDMIVDLPESKSTTDNTADAFDAILTVVDHFSKRTHFIPVRKTMDTREYANIIIKEVVKHHLMPDSILSDCGSIFSSCF